MIFFIGLVVLYLCCKFGPLKGKVFFLKLLTNFHNIIAGHCIDLFLIIAIITILYSLWLLAAAGSHEINIITGGMHL